MTVYEYEDETVNSKIVPATGDELVFHGTVTRGAGLTTPLIQATANNVLIHGDGIIDGGFTASGTNPLIELTGTGNTIRGESSTKKLTIKNNLHTLVQFLNPSNCTAQDLVVTDGRNGTSTTPTTGDSALGVGILFYGSGTGNIANRCSAYRIGMHGFANFFCTATMTDCVTNGTYGFFGFSSYQVPGTTTLTRCKAYNTRRENLNAAECTTVNYVDCEGYDGQTDYGMCVYLCDGGTITNPKVYRSFKNGLSIEGSSSFEVSGGTFIDCCRGSYTGHYAAILLQGSGSNVCQANYIHDNTITDIYGYLRMGVMEVENLYCSGNLILDNNLFGVRAANIRLANGSASGQYNNDQNDRWTITTLPINTEFDIPTGRGACIGKEVELDGELSIDGVLYLV